MNHLQNNIYLNTIITNKKNAIINTNKTKTKTIYY
jgi:hypothetical protein